MKYSGIVLMLILYLHTSEAHQKKHKHPYEQNINFDDNSLQTFKNDLKSNDQAVKFYLRLVKQIFRKERFKSHPHNVDYFIANVPLKVNKKQYEMLGDSDINGLNLEEIDELLEEVLVQSKKEEHSIHQVLFDYYRQEIIASLPNFKTPVIISILAIIVIYFVNRLFQFSKLTYSAMIFIAIVIVCSISFAMTYHDCLNDLESEQMIQLSKENPSNNPCKDYHGERESTWSFVKAKILGSYENQCLEHLRKTFKPSKKYCDPLEVFARWSAKIQMSYIGSVTENFFEILTKFTSSSNFITKLVIWISGIIFFGVLIITILKVAVTSGFQGVFGFLSTSPAAQKNESLTALSTKMDALLNENLEIKRELSVIRECSVERQLKNTSPPRTKIHKLSMIKEATMRDNSSSESSC